MKEEIEVVWPSGKRAQLPQPLAPRLDTLEGKTICGLYNGAYHFDQTWPLIQQLLSGKYPGIKFVGWEEFGNYFGKEEESLLEALPAKLKHYGCDAVVSGRGC
ncbi:hypothetical protein ACFLWL_03030 [Chloroflexota bacterium]